MGNSFGGKGRNKVSVQMEADLNLEKRRGRSSNTREQRAKIAGVSAGTESSPSVFVEGPGLFHIPMCQLMHLVALSIYYGCQMDFHVVFIDPEIYQKIFYW